MTCLSKHKRNLRLLQKQAATFGAGEMPLRLLNQIEAEEEKIGEIRQKIRISDEPIFSKNPG